MMIKCMYKMLEECHIFDQNHSACVCGNVSDLRLAFELD